MQPIKSAELPNKKKGIVQSTDILGSKRDRHNISSVVYESNRLAVPQNYAGDAFHTSEIDTATDRDNRTILERNVKLKSEISESGDTAVYRGQGAYSEFRKTDLSQVGANKYTGYASTS